MNNAHAEKQKYANIYFRSYPMTPDVKNEDCAHFHNFLSFPLFL